MASSVTQQRLRSFGIGGRGTGLPFYDMWYTLVSFGSDSSCSVIYFQENLILNIEIVDGVPVPRRQAAFDERRHLIDQHELKLAGVLPFTWRPLIVGGMPGSAHLTT